MPESLGKLRRYQRATLFGGGVLVTLLVLLVFVIGFISILRDYIASERQNYVIGKNQIINEIKINETSFRNSVFNAQLYWHESREDNADLVRAFRENGEIAVIHPYSVMAFGGPARSAHPGEFGRYLGLTAQLARINAASSLNRRHTLEAYYYSASETFFALIPEPRQQDPRVAAGLRDRSGLLNGLRVDFGDAADACSGNGPVLHWLPPFTNPLTGERRIRLTARACDEAKPFAVLVVQYPPSMLVSQLSAARFRGAFLVISADNQLITGASRTQASDDSLVRTVLGMDLPNGSLRPNATAYREGALMFGDRLESTGWTVVYALSWRDVAAGVALQAGVLALTTTFVLAVMWPLLFWCNRRVFMPVLDRSRRVFESEKLSRTVIQTMPIGIGLIALETGELLLRSPAMAEIASRCATDDRVLTDELIRRYDGCAGRPATMQEDLTFTARNGHEIHLAVNAARGRYRNKDVLVAALVDVTEKRQLVRQLRDAIKAADSANAAKSAFLAAMSHEIRTPLNAILGNLELLAYSSLTAAQRDRLTTIRSSSDGLLAIISDILDFAKIEAGEISLERIEFDIVRVVERALTIFSPTAQAKGVRLYGQFQTASTQLVLGDPVRVGQILHNLLSNAIKFTAQGTVTVRLSVAQLAGERRQIFMVVEDTGMGISTEQQGKLFKAFSQGDSSITRRFGGTGLGLVLCRRLVEAMGGTIGVTSAPQAGSRFTVRLPLAATCAIARDRPWLGGGRAVLVSFAVEWCDYAVPHLETWGLTVAVYRHPALVPDDVLETARVLILFEDPGAWRAADENRIVEQASSVVDCYRDGPVQPLRTGRVVSVSCYSLGGLAAALRQALTAGTPRQLARVPAGPGRAARTAHARRSLRVLVVEDNPVNGSLLREQLEVLGCDACVVAHGRDALDVLANADWDVLLTDLNLPEMSGYEVADKALKRMPSLAVIAVTAHATVEERRRCDAAGISRMLTKPLSLRQLHNALLPIASARDVCIHDFADDAKSALGPRSLPAELRHSWAASVSASLQAIRAARAGDDTAPVLAELHSMKGTLGIFGKSTLARRCAALERAVKRGGMTVLCERFDAFEAALHEEILR